MCARMRLRSAYGAAAAASNGGTCEQDFVSCEGATAMWWKASVGVWWWRRSRVQPRVLRPPYLFAPSFRTCRWQAHGRALSTRWCGDGFNSSRPSPMTTEGNVSTWWAGGQVEVYLALLTPPRPGVHRCTYPTPCAGSVDPWRRAN